MNEDKTTPQGQVEENKITTPDSGIVKDNQDAPKQDLPEKLQGKDAAEIAKMYAEAERKLGEQGTELGTHRKFQSEMAVVLKAINDNPDLRDNVEKELRKMAGEDPDKKDNKVDSPKDRIEETRRVVEAQTIQQFEQRVGLNALEFEEKKNIYKRIGDELVEMLDPGGNKTYEQVLDSVDLGKLPSMLDKAYYLASRDGQVQKAVDEAVAKVRANNDGMIGSIPSSGGNSEGPGLSPDQQKVARRLGISEEDYLKQVRQINEDSKRP